VIIKYTAAYSLLASFAPNTIVLPHLGIAVQVVPNLTYITYAARVSDQRGRSGERLSAHCHATVGVVVTLNCTDCNFNSTAYLSLLGCPTTAWISVVSQSCLKGGQGEREKQKRVLRSEPAYPSRLVCSNPNKVSGCNKLRGGYSSYRKTLYRSPGLVYKT
jgi:hypothetical protein